MSEINERNIQGANVTVVGYAGGPAQFPAYDKEGTRGVYEVSIGVGEGYKKGDEWVNTGTSWYVYSASGDWANELKRVGKGDKIRVDNAKLEVREYERRDGAKALGLGIRFGEFSILESKGEAPAAAPSATADVWNTPGSYSDETPF